MSTQRFALGKRFCWNSVWYRVKRLLPNQQLCIEQVATGETQVVAEMDLVRAWANGTLQFEGLPPAAPQAAVTVAAPLADYPASGVAIAQYRLAVLRPLLALPPQARTKNAIRARVAEIRQQPSGPLERGLGTAVSVRSVYRWLAAYQASGEDVRALLPHTTDRGGKGESRLPAEVLAIVDTVLHERYLQRERVSHKDLWHLVVARVAEENRARGANAQLPQPSLATITRRVATLDLRARYTAQHGARAARRAFRQVGQMQYPTRPLERCEMDHTKVDVLVIDEQDNLPLGRPTLTYCVDTATRYPLGFYLSFEPPSYYPVMECLYHAICPKALGPAPMAPQHAWLAYGVPLQLVVDNGKEFVGQDLADACTQLGIELVRSPVRTPEFKAGVERQFRTLNTGLFHTLPGTTFSNVLQRGDYASAAQACIALPELVQLLTLYIVDIYAEEFHRGLQDIPARCWERAQADGTRQSRLVADPKELLILLGRVVWRTVHHYGLELEGLRYNCAALGELRAELTQTSSQLVKIKYHPGDLSWVYVLHPTAQPPHYLPVPALAQEYTAGLSLWKHRAIRALARQQAGPVDVAALGRAKQQIQAWVNSARTRKTQTARPSRPRWGTQAVPPDTPAPALNVPPVLATDPSDANPAASEVGWEVVNEAGLSPV